MKEVCSTLVLLLFVVCACLWFQKPQPTVTTKTVAQTITVPGDSVAYEVNVPVPVPVYVDRFADTGKTIVDTAAIISQYLERVNYNDTIRDSSMIAILNETVSRNRIVTRKVWLQNLRPQAITYNKTIVEPSPQWLAGVSGNVIGGRIGIGAGIVYIRKHDAFSATIYTNGAQAAYYYRLH